MKTLFTLTLSALVGLTLLVGGAGSARAASGEAGAQSPPATFRGTADGYDGSHAVYLERGLVVVRAKHAGTLNFSLGLTIPKPGQAARHSTGPSVHLINHIGQYNGGAAGRVREPGLYVLDLKASGSYEITVEQPPLDLGAGADQREFLGRGQQVTPVVMVPAGRHRISVTHDGMASYGPTGWIRLYLLDMNGVTISGDTSGRLFNERGPFSGTVELEVILEGPHIFHVDADGAWTLRID